MSSMQRCRFVWWLVVAGLAGLAACGTSSTADTPAVDVVAEGLLNPVGLAMLPDGSILVAEEGTGNDDTSAGVSRITAEGRVQTIVTGLPSSRDSGDLSGVPLVAVSPDGETVYLAHFGAGHLLTFPTAAIESAPLGAADLEPVMTPLNEVRLTNPFDLAFDAAGVPVVADASANGVATMNPDGTTRFIHRFGDLETPDRPEITIDPVPTGIARLGDEYLVTLTGGCPYPRRSGELVAVDTERNQRVVLDDLDMPIDVAVGANGEIWVLEFARFEEDASCFTGEGYLPETGRLSRIEDGRRHVVAEGLDYPGSLLVNADGSVLVSEVFGGRVLRLSWPDAEASGALRDVAAEVGLDFRHGSFRQGVSEDPVAAMGAGLCWIDYDDDGWLDLYLVNSHSADDPDPKASVNALYRNVQGRFESVAGGSGADLVMRGNGCVAADFDGDGWVDLYVTADGPNALLLNQGDGTFLEAAAVAGVDAAEWSSAAAAGDVNGDGRVDLFVGAYLDLAVQIAKPSGAFPQDHPGLLDRLYLNESEPGRPAFQEVTLAAGLERADRTLGAVFSDVDSDGDIDLYVANDGNQNRLYRNDSASGEVQFVDVTETAAVGDSGSGMGVAAGDFDGNGRFDLHVSNWDRELNALYTNLTSTAGRPTFQYSTFRIGYAGLGLDQTGWGTAWADFDHDGDEDLLVVNGHVPVTDLRADAQAVRLYRNLGADGMPGELRDWSEAVAALRPLSARGSAVADFDNDGDLDVAINSVGGSAVLLRNDLATGHWLEVQLEPFAPGANVTVESAEGSLVREARAGSSYLASEDPRLHFGLGTDDGEVTVVVAWPDGTVERREGVSVDRLVIVRR